MLTLGLLYYNARFYVPGIGRFANADTIVPDPVNPQQLNRYAYVLGNPLSYFDPTGHSCDSPESGDEYRACQAQQDRQQQEKEILASTVQIIATAHVFMDGMWIPIVSRSHATLKDGQYLVTHNHFSFMELIDQGFKVVIDNVTLRTTEGKQLHGNWNDFTVHNFEEAPGTLLLDFGSQRLGRIAGRFGIQSANFDNTMPVMGDEVAQINWDGQVSYVQWGKVIGGPKRSGTWIIELNSLTRGGASGGGVFFGRNHIGNNFYTGSTHSGAALNPLAVTR